MIKYRRVLLKLSGESLMGDQGFGIDSKMLQHYAEQVKELIGLGVEVAIVIGGGNIFRGLKLKIPVLNAYRVIIWECWLP